MRSVKMTIVVAVCLVAVLISCNLAGAQIVVGKNLLPNPSFEMLSPVGDNFPIGWAHSKLGGGEANVTIDKDASEGGMAIRMKAAAEGVAVVNSDMVPVKSGTLTFHYKAISSGNEGRNFVVYVIAMTSEGREITRQGVPIPKEHVGDGQWHVMTYDFFFPQNECAKVLAGPRINEGGDKAAGEWLLDDFSLIIKKFGPRPTIEAMFMPQPVLTMGKKDTLVVQISNTGDEDIVSSQLCLTLPDGLRPDGIVNSNKLDGKTEYSMPIDKVAPGQWKRIEWVLTPQKTGEYDMNLNWKIGESNVTRSRHTVCVNKMDARVLYTGSDGYWRAMPKFTTMQEGNNSKASYVKRKLSSELPDSMFGMAGHLPRSKDFEAIFEPEFLIDGKYNTNWSGRAHATQVPGSVDFVEIKFPTVRKIKQVKLVPYWNSEGFPVDFTIKVHRGRNWSLAYEAKGASVNPVDGKEGSKKPHVITLPAGADGDGIRLEVTRFSGASGFFCDLGGSNCLRLSEIEAIDDTGANAALASAGATVTSSATHRTYYNSAKTIRETYNELFELGMKWIRVGQWGDWTAWAMVEQKKGQYHIDPEMDQAITDTVKNGVNILYTLAYGNPIYEKTRWLWNPGQVWRHGHPFTGDGGPTKPESIQGFVNYAKFVATHFKGRIKHYEIWNEENSWAWYGEPPSPKAFGTLIRETSKALKQIDPEIEIMVGGTAAYAPVFISETLEACGGEHVDAVAFHPYGAPYAEKAFGSLDVINGVQSPKPPTEYGCETMEDLLAFFRKTFGKYNDHLQIWQNEWNACPYREDDVYPTDMSEIMEAKQIARYYLSGVMNNMPSVWWSLINENYISDWGILREADRSRKPAFFTTQAVTANLSGAKPDNSVEVTAAPMLPELRCKPLRGYKGELMVVVWQAIKPNSDFVGKPITLRVKAAKVRSVEGVDTLRAMTQKLKFKQDGEFVVIEGLLAYDAPVIVKIK